MEYVLNPDNSRNRNYRPYILFEETTYNDRLYNPYQSFHYGLYEKDYVDQEQWKPYANSFFSKLNDGRGIQWNKTNTQPVTEFSKGFSGKRGQQAAMYQRLYAVSK